MAVRGNRDGPADGRKRVVVPFPRRPRRKGRATSGAPDTERPPGGAKIIPFAAPDALEAPGGGLAARLGEKAVDRAKRVLAARTIAELEGGLDDARAALDRAVGVAPDPLPALVARAGVRVLQRDHEGARQDYGDALGHRPGDARLWLRRAECSRKLGDDDLARQDLDMAIRLAPAEPQARLARADLLEEAGELPRAREDLGVALRHLPHPDQDADHPDFDAGDDDARGSLILDRAHLIETLWIRRSEMAFTLGDGPAAIADLAANIAASAGFGYPHYKRAEAYLRLGNVDLALADADAALALDDCPDYHMLRGEILLRRGETQAGLRAYALCLKRGRYPGALRGYAQGLIEAGRPAKALEPLDELLERSPRDHEARWGRAQALRALGRLHEACAELDRALRLDPASATYHAWRGTLRLDRFRAGEPSRLLRGALDDLDWAIHRSPGVAWYHGLRSRVHWARGDSLRERFDLDRAVLLAPGDAEWWWERALLRREAGDRGWREDAERAAALGDAGARKLLRKKKHARPKAAR